jgi:hypothetical protein
MKIRVIVDGKGKLVGAHAPVAPGKSKETPTSASIRPADSRHDMYEMEGPENLFEGDAQTVSNNISRLFQSKLSSNQLSRVY